MENALYVHLRSKGYEVSVGIIGKLECDFIVRKRERYAYVRLSFWTNVASIQKTLPRNDLPLEIMRIILL